MPGQNRQGGGMPGGGMGGGGMGADIMGGMYMGGPLGGPGSSSLTPGVGAPGFQSNYGAGDMPADFTSQMFALQQRCLAGDGAACNQLQVKQQQQGQLQQQWQDKMQKGQYRYQNNPGGGSMGARSSGPVRY